MLTKKGALFAGFIFTVFLFAACEQKSKTVLPKPDSIRIPVAFNDSSILSIDKSPMDMSYFPEDYPKQKMITPDMPNPVARVIYSRPKKNGRVIFGDSTVKENVIQRFGQEWRLGANEATEIEFFKPVNINGKNLAAGRYIMYCIPSPDSWKIIFNTNLYSWGLHFDRTKDIAEIDLPIIKNDVSIEYFTLLCQRAGGGFEIVMAWGDMKALLPVKIN
ncbi:MAG: DUF2911 domain-containing protein [Ferruginibacter sp.]